MSRSYTIHVRPKCGQQPSNLVDDVSRIIGQEFVANGAGDGVQALTAVGVVDVYYEGSTFEDDAGIAFSRYPWYVEMVEPRAEADRPPVVAQIWLVYHGLVDTGRYGCALVLGLAQKLATNDSDDLEPREIQ